jgi:hypothetical protein
VLVTVDDYARFVEIFGLQAEKDQVIGLVNLNGIDTYFGWVTGDKRFLDI